MWAALLEHLQSRSALGLMVQQKSEFGLYCSHRVSLFSVLRTPGRQPCVSDSRHHWLITGEERHAARAGTEAYEVIMRKQKTAFLV
jgi:hypothetical protein